MAEYCSIIPQIKTKEGGLVDSKLFTDLLGHTAHNRSVAKRLYLLAKRDTELPTDMLGEPVFSEVLNKYDDSLTQYAVSNRIPLEGQSYKKGLAIAKKLRELFPNYDILTKTRADGGYFIHYAEKMNKEPISREKIPVDRLNNIITSAEQKGNMGIFEYILSNSNNAPLKYLVQKLISNNDKLNHARIQFVNDSKERYAGRYYPTSGTILINKDHITTEEVLHETILHEYLHAVFYNTLENPKTEQEKEFVDTVKKYMDYFIKNSNPTSRYGFTNIHEFVSEIMTNSDFQTELRFKKPTLWNKILTLFRRLILGKDYNNNEELKTTFHSVIEFIPQANAKLAQGLYYDKKSSIIGEINDYATKKITQEGSLKEKEKFMLHIHKKVKFEIGKLNSDMKELDKKVKKLDDEFRTENKKIVDDYLVYTGGVYDTGYQNSANFKDLKKRIEGQKAEIEAQREELEKRKEYLKSQLADLKKVDTLDTFEQKYVEIANDHLNSLEGRQYDLNNKEDQDKLAEDYVYLTTIINTHGLEGLKERASTIADQLFDKISSYISTVSNEYLNTKELGIPEITIKELMETNDDINILEMLFTGFGDYPRLEAQLIHNITLEGKQRARLASLGKGQEILDHINKLKSWAKKNGYTNAIGKGSVRKAYQLFVEISHMNRLDLIKPYTAQYYMDVNNKFRELATEKNEDVKKDIKKWLQNNYYTKPATGEYINPRYTYIQKHPELKEFYEFFKETVKEGYSRLPNYVGTTNEEKIPSMMREAFWDFFSIRKDNIFKSITLALKTLMIGQGRVEMYDEDGSPKSKIHISEFNQDEIKIRMIGEVKADLKSFDLGKILYEFNSFTHDYQQMTAVLPKVRMIQALVETKNYISGNFVGGKTAVRGGYTKMHKAIQMYIDNKVRSEGDHHQWKIPMMDEKIYNNEGKIIGERSYYLSDVVRSLIKYTRMLYLGFNPFSAIGNLSAGMIADITEATGGEFFTAMDLAKAIKVYSGASVHNRLNKLNIFSSNDELSKVALVSDLIQPLQEIGEWEEKKRIDLGASTIGGSLLRGITNETFTMQQWGEDFVQKITMIAYLMHQKVTGTDSNEYSYWDLFDEKNGKLVFNEALAGFKFDERLNKEREVIKKINRELHGNYSRDNSSVYEGYVMYQGMMVFKKWIPSMIQARFQGKRFDYAKGKFVEGRYRTLVKFGLKYMKSMMDSIKHSENRLKSVEATEMDMVAAKKTLADVLITMAFVTLSKVLMPPPDEEDDKPFVPDWWEQIDISMWDSEKEFNDFNGILGILLKSMMDTSNKLSSEAMQFYQPTFYFDTVTRFAVVSMLGQVGQFLEETWKVLTLPEDHKSLKYKSGPNKGNSKMLTKGARLIPIYRQIDKGIKTGERTAKDLQHLK